MATGSQHGEDKWIIANLPIPQVGYFIEVGASDGIENSNTLLFERMGWRGLLIEPDLRSFNKLYGNRPQTPIIKMAIQKERGQASFYLNDNPTWSGLMPSRSDKWLGGIGQTRVAAGPLSDIIEQHGIEHIDLLSIDTEGTELDVWQSKGKIRPTIVIIEHDTAGLPSNKQAIDEQLTADNYRLVHETQVNFIYVDNLAVREVSQAA